MKNRLNVPKGVIAILLGKIDNYVRNLYRAREVV